MTPTKKKWVVGLPAVPSWLKVNRLPRGGYDWSTIHAEAYQYATKVGADKMKEKLRRAFPHNKYVIRKVV
jgi:hypothetical protein